MSIATDFVPASAEVRLAPIRVMVVDDAVVVRGLLARWIETEPGLQVAASMRSGREAIEQLERTNPDVVVLDVDMPDIDGITALPRLLEKRRDLVVIMASTLTRRNAEISLKALALGAADYIPKPQTTRELTTATAFRRELIEKIKALGRRRKQRIACARASSPAVAAAAPRAGVRIGGDAVPVANSVLPPVRAGAQFNLRPYSSVPPGALLIGASTGGPQALSALLAKLGGTIDHAPILIVQHMPPTFTTILAEHLARASGHPAHEATDGEPVRAGQIYIAPGGRHMRVIRRSGMPSIEISDGPSVNFCKPAVDPLFASAAAVWGPRALAVVLTGMGSDGTRGAAELIAAGGACIAQDEETSVVWGMPGAVAQAGLCSAVLPLAEMAPKIVNLFSGGRG